MSHGFDRDAWCEKTMPQIWQAVVRIRAEAALLGVECTPGIAEVHEDEPSALEMVLTFYSGHTVLGCAGWTDEGKGWSWYFTGEPRSSPDGRADEDALIAAMQQSHRINTIAEQS